MRLSLLSTTAAAPHCQIDYRSSQYAHSRTDRPGGTCAPGSATGEAWRLNQPETGSFRRPRRNLRWVAAKSADRDLLLPRLRQ